MRRITKEATPEILLNVDQACNVFCLTGTTRQHILKRFKAVTQSKADWLQLFKQQRIS